MNRSVSPEQADPSEKRPMRLLSIDGGGMKGAYACSYLAVLEDHFNVKLTDHFDLVAGTSTGGIIALGIGARKSARQLLDFYKEQGSAIFPRSFPGIRFVNQLTRGHGYPNRALRLALKVVFTDPSTGRELVMADSAVRLCIPAINAATSEPRVFKATGGEDQTTHLDRDRNLKMADVALATSAAPWYLPIVPVDEAGARFTYIDGGLWANNPALVAITEALTYYCGPEREFEGVQLLSVGLPSSTGYENNGRYRRGLQFVDQLLTYSMESSKQGAHYVAGFLLREHPNSYLRVEPSNLTETQKGRLKLDSSNEKAVNELAMLGEQDAQRAKSGAFIKKLFR